MTAKGRQVAVVDTQSGEVLEEREHGAALARFERAAPAPLSFGAVLERLGTPEAIAQQKQLMELYDKAVDALVGPNDVQEEGGRQFKRKSAWRKIGRFFGISTEIVSVESRWEWDEEEQLKHFVARVTVRGTAPWGQTAEMIGGCSTREKRFYYYDKKLKRRVPNPTARGKAEHDCEATAATRALNRVVSDLVAAGEVSAEDVEDGDHADVQPDRRESRPTGDPAMARRIAQLLEAPEIQADRERSEYLAGLRDAASSGPLNAGEVKWIATAERWLERQRAKAQQQTEAPAEPEAEEAKGPVEAMAEAAAEAKAQVETQAPVFDDDDDEDPLPF